MTWVWYTQRSSLVCSLFPTRLHDVGMVYAESISGIGSLFPTRLNAVGMVYAEIISGMFIIPYQIVWRGYGIRREHLWYRFFISHQVVWRGYGIRREHLWYRFIISHQVVWRGYGIRRDHLWYVHYSPLGCMTWVWYTQRSSLVCSLFPTRLHDVGMVYAEIISGMFIIPHQAVWRGYGIRSDHLWYR